MSEVTDPRVEAAARAVEDAMLRQGKSPDAHDLARAALKAADTAAWQPIESAPKDGTYVDLWVINCDDEGQRFSGAFFGPIPHTCGEAGQYCDCCPEEGDCWIDGIFDERISGRITHWMPLPLPPEPMP
ncbi:DUF551 domain-containing protein [Gluconobacter japonicus]|uniref:DUF551 domain-containing protein n=1 Tax=Gluconobacter japonicus TaxID=376620 RepID=UPI0024AE6241|nr:DUF551 domain-containing protein [Gluconobacter japonicus]MDI6653736.1 DUF551 domain-containing protein [Gluconobacter japonicus]